MARHRPRSEWLRLVEAQRRSGVGLSEFARRQGVEVAALRRWRAEFAAAAATHEAPQFVELRVEPPPPSPPTMTLEVGEARLLLSCAPDPQWLAALLQALAVRPC